MNKVTAKRKRRRAKLRLKFGIKAVRAHREISGRTGMIHCKRTPGKASRYTHAWPNPEVYIVSLGGVLF